MKIIHTSDWHLGRPLAGRRRYQAEREFLAWLVERLEILQIEALLVAGDIFDNTAPDNLSQSLYYDFLHKVSALPHCNVVITAGNHDSPSFLEAPRALLENFNIHVIGGCRPEPDSHILVLNNSQGQPGLIVAAAPYLRDRDIRLAFMGETPEDKENLLIAGLADYYQRLGRAAQARRQALGPLPLVVMGHLFAAGGQALEGDGSRELYLGSLGLAPASIFPETADYLALGHLHAPQTVAGRENWRYSGSPLQLHFSDRPAPKSVVCLDLTGPETQVELLPVPEFQPLRRLRGSGPDILAQVEKLKEAEARAWLEVIHEGGPLESDFRAQLAEAVRGSGLVVISCFKFRAEMALAVPLGEDSPNLADLSPEQVFCRCLETSGTPESEWAELKQSHSEVLRAVLEGAEDHEGA